MNHSVIIFILMHWISALLVQAWSLHMLERFNERRCNEHNDISPCPIPNYSTEEQEDTQMEAWTKLPIKVLPPEPLPIPHLVFLLPSQH